MKTTIWYEFTDKEDVKTLRDAADKLEKTGRVMFLLPNVELDDPPTAGGAAGAASGNCSGGGSAGGSGVGGWTAADFKTIGVAGSLSGSGAGAGGSKAD